MPNAYDLKQSTKKSPYASNKICASMNPVMATSRLSYHMKDTKPAFTERVSSLPRTSLTNGRSGVIPAKVHRQMQSGRQLVKIL